MFTILQKEKFTQNELQWNNGKVGQWNAKTV